MKENQRKLDAEEGLSEFNKRAEKGGTTVYVRGTSEEDITQAINIFKRRIEKLGILDEFKNRQHYIKPSELKKLNRKKHAKQ